MHQALSANRSVTVFDVSERLVAVQGVGGSRIFFKKGIVSMRVKGKRPRAKGMGEVGWGKG